MGRTFPRSLRLAEEYAEKMKTKKGEVKKNTEKPKFFFKNP